MTEERRKRTRVAVGFEASIAIQDKTINVKTLNLSMSGLSFTGSYSFQEGEKCVIHLPLSDEAHLSIEARIIRSRDKETVASFQSMDAETFYHLKRLLQFNTADPERIEKELATSAFP